MTLTGNVPASVEPGASFQLTNISQTLALPGAIFVAGYNLGLLVVGQNTVPGNITTTIEGTNTIEGVQNTSTESISLTVTITDPDGIPGTGDEFGTDASTTVTYDDQSWTAGPAGTIEFREDTVTPQSATVGGIVTTATIGGILTVRFGCNPGTVLAGPPETISLVDPAASFATTQSESSSSTTTTTLPGGTTTTTTLPPVTLDVGIDATKLVIVDKLTAADKAKTVFVAKTPDAAKGPGTDPDTIGAVLDVSYMGASATAGQFVVPAGPQRRRRLEGEQGHGREVREQGGPGRPHGGEGGRHQADQAAQAGGQEPGRYAHRHHDGGRPGRGWRRRGVHGAERREHRAALHELRAGRMRLQVDRGRLGLEAGVQERHLGRVPRDGGL